MTNHPKQGEPGGPVSRGKLFWIGWTLTILPALFLLFAAMNSILLTQTARDGMAQMEYPESTARPIGVALLISTALYLFPRTAVLGAILLTGYLGGAVATHVRVGDPIGTMLMPAVFGAIVWFGLFFRDARVRAITPWRR